MTPKEKAIDLVNKFLDIATPTKEEYGKQCALIAIDEMTKYIPNIYHNDMVKEKYWQEVKIEIEKL